MKIVIPVVTESLIVITFVALALRALTVTPGGDILAQSGQFQWWLFESSLVIPTIIIALVGYWGLRLIWRPYVAFWLTTVLGLLAHGPAILAHNRLDWFYLFAGSSPFESGLSTVETTSLFAGALALLSLLHRFIAISNRQRSLYEQGVDSSELRALMVNEMSIMIAVATIGLLLTLGFMFLGAAIGDLDTVLDRIPWTVLAVGVTATVVVVILLLVWAKDNVRDRAGPDTR